MEIAIDGNRVLQRFKLRGFTSDETLFILKSSGFNNPVEFPFPFLRPANILLRRDTAAKLIKHRRRSIRRQPKTPYIADGRAPIIGDVQCL